MAADAAARSMPIQKAWWAAAAMAAALAALTFFMTIGLRPDIADAAQTVRFLFKLVFTLTLTVTAYGVFRLLSRPGAEIGRLAPLLAAAPILLGAAVIVELFALPPPDWTNQMIGSNAAICLISILLIGIGPLGIFLGALHYGAPTRPGLAGAAAGLLAGGLAATFYALHCTDDSPLFVATWYTAAIAGLTAAGALLSRRVARW